jgi:hypothetical protein
MKSAVEQMTLNKLFVGPQRTLEIELSEARETIDHPVIKGDASEAHWRQMLQRFLPRRYCVCKGQVVDSRGGQSEQIDVIIHDANYCPVLREVGGSCLVPAESVYAVFEVKQELNAEYVAAAGKKAVSVRDLFRTSAEIVDRGRVEPPRPLPRILAGALALTTVWTDGLGNGFRTAFAELQDESSVDLGCVLGVGAFETPPEGGDLIVYAREHALVMFFLRLVHRLQQMGTVPAIDWNAYFESAKPLIARL